MKGVMNADSMQTAKEILLQQNVLVKHIKSSHSKNKSVLSRQEVLNFTRDLNQLLNASLPLYESLKAIVEKSRHLKFHGIFVDLCDKIQQGERFSLALQAYPKSFSPIYISMVAAAEESGTLAVVFKEILRMLVQEDKLKKQLFSAMIYPMFLGFFCMGVITALFTFIIPSLRELLDGRDLHPFTQSILSLSDWMVANRWIFLPSLLMGLLLLILFFRHPKGKKFWQRVVIKIPIIGSMKLQSIMLKFCRTFSVLLANGVSIVKALDMASRVMGHFQFENLMIEAKERLIEGKKLSEVLAQSKLIPTLVTTMIATAEQTATLDQMLASLAEIYEADLDKNIQRFSSLIQPVMILILGLIVGLVLLSILLPLTDVTSFLN